MKVLAFTGARSDWGLLEPVLSALRDSARLDVQLCVTGQHLVDGSGSLDTIFEDGFSADYVVPMGLGYHDSAAWLTSCMGRCTSGVGDVLARAEPDLCLLLGDRYEMLAVASAALLAGVPIAHVCGGDVTRGAFDDAIRHAITKMSALHFVSSEDSRRRVVQLGEHPSRVFLCGSPGVDRICRQRVLDRTGFLARVGLEEQAEFFLISYHAPTLSDRLQGELDALLAALAHFPRIALLLSGSNADPGGLQIDAAFQELARRRSNAVFHTTLGSELYFSALRHARVLVGNSSSGLYEAPSFRLPTVDIGARQAGRLRATSVVGCSGREADIAAAIRRAVDLKLTDVTNPYGDGRASGRILDALLEIGDPGTLLQKTFHDIAS